MLIYNVIIRSGSLDRTDTYSRLSAQKKISKPFTEEGLDTKAVTTDSEERQKVPKSIFDIELTF